MKRLQLHRPLLAAGKTYLFAAEIALLAVTLLAILLFAGDLSEGTVASAYSDPVDKIRAQDESIYVNSALGMAADGDWLTPRFLGRLLLYKPPLLIWLSALSVKLFGTSLTALRLPSLIAAIIATALLFWLCRLHSRSAGWVCVLVLIANPLWFVFAGLCYTDMLFTATLVAAMYIVYRDPTLDSTRSRWMFAACCAAGILTKNVAGLLPVVIWMLFTIAQPEKRVTLRRAAGVCVSVMVLAAPWHLYQAAVHPHWFWADYVQVQLLGFGLQPPAQSTSEPQLWFYWKRLFTTDPVLICLALMAMPAFLLDLKKRSIAVSNGAVLLGAWLVVVTGALLIFRYRNLPYALNLVPPLAVLGALYAPGGSWRVLVLCAAFVIKASSPDAVFGLPLVAKPIPSAAALLTYADRGRPNDLIVVDPDDEFYSATLPLPHVRYVFIDNKGVVVRYAPHLKYLGITVSVDQFNNLENLRGEYLERLKRWGVSSSKPLGTTIVAISPGEVGQLVQANTRSDFSLPIGLFHMLPHETFATHQLVPANRRIFLLAQDPHIVAGNSAE